MAIWNDINKAARSAGILTFAMNQMNTAGYQQHNGCRGGYCFGLASIWVKLLWSASNYPYDPASREYIGTDWRAVDAQKAFDAELAKATNAFQPLDKGLAKAGLKRLTGRAQDSDGSISCTGLYSILQGNGGIEGGDGTYIIGMKGKLGSHAIAINNAASQWWSLFDGNNGHFRMQGNTQFRAFLIWYLGSGATRYLTDYATNWLTAGVVPTSWPK